MSIEECLIGMVLYDEIDRALIDRYPWRLSACGYVVANKYEPRDCSMPMNHSNRVHKILRLHRLIMNAKDGIEVDHVNGNRLDNRRSNLRLATSSQNKMNSKIRADNSSGVKGVHFDRSRKKWMAYINAGKIRKNIGRYESKDEASAARSSAEKTLHGEYARIMP